MNGKRGYTLIEILVALTILGLIFFYGFASFREFSRRQALLSSARSLVGEIRLTQEFALSGNKPAGCIVLDGFRVKFSPAQYGVVAVCEAAELSIGKDGISLADGVTLNATVPSITFKVLGQGTDIATPDMTITLTQEGTDNVQTIVVSASGEIN